LLEQFFHFFAILLWIAGGLAVLAGMPELGVAIFLVVVVNGVFAFVQERRAEHAAHELQQLLPRRCMVRRDGALHELDAREVVREDVVALKAGDRISADVRVVQGRGLLVDNSTLTGESEAVGIGVDETAFAGAFVVEGDAFCLVVATGSQTRLSRVAELTQHRTRPRTPLAHELDRLVRIVAIVALGVGLAFFSVGSLVGLPLRDGFLFAIGVAVALVPEGLLPTVTLSLAMGASRMAKRGALVRRLEAVETLGSTTFICSDKTGTLTCNLMNAVEIWTPVGVGRVRGEGYQPSAELDMTAEVRSACEGLALAAVRCSNGRAVERAGEWVARGDPMEAALHSLSLRLGLDLSDDERARPETGRFSFDPRRRRMSVLAGERAYVKGAPDSMIERTTNGDGAVSAFNDMASRGLRVIAVATRTVDPAHCPETADEVERELTLLGLIGLFDPPRSEVRHALAACHAAGMRVAIITGDHPGTALAVAREVGLSAGRVVTGEELPDDEAMLGALMDRDGVVACRVSPEQKFKIAEALQARGHIVAMTGDGVNDGPALRQADIGIAMGRSGTDVAREAADLVLLDDRFETIVLAIEQGRSTFANIRRFLTYHLTDNVAELAPFAFWALSGGRFPLALSVLQVLCLDLLSDQFPALALGAEAPSPRVLQERPQRGHLIDRPLLRRALLVLGPAEAVAAMVAFTAVLISFGVRPGIESPESHALHAASGASFLAIVFGQTANAFACRSSSRPAWRVPLRGNRLLLLALGVSWAIVALLFYLPAANRLLGHSPPTALGFGVAALALPLVLATDALHKRWTKEPARS
jgi:calcium-translocating P-type ATPase